MKSKNKLILLTITALILGAVIYLMTKNSTPLSGRDPKKNPLEKKVEMTFAPKTQEASVLEQNENLELVSSMKELPIQKDLENLNEEEIHHTPKAVLEGGMLIGELIEDAEKHPEKKEMTLKFLKTCAENEDLLQAVRALCWKKTLTQISEWDIFMPISDAEVPDEIKKLALKLP